MDSGRNSVLAIKDEIAAVPVTYLGLVGDSLIKILRDIFDLPELLIPLVSVAGNLQLAAVDDHFLVGFHYVLYGCLHHFFFFLPW